MGFGEAFVFIAEWDGLPESLQVERLAKGALVDVRVLADALVTFLGRALDSHEKPNIEVDGEGNERLNALSMLVCDRVNGVKHHAKCLLVTIRTAERCSTIFVEADVRLACTQHSHVRESHAKQSIVCQASDRTFKERYCRAVRVQIHDIKHGFITTELIH